MIRIPPTYYLILIGLSCFLRAECQEFSRPSTVYTIREGLVQQQVRCFLEDSKGYIWIGTMAGFSRFDGRLIVSYGQRTQFPGRQIYTLKEGVDGSIWYRSNEAVFRFDGQEEQILTDSSIHFWRQQAPRLWALLSPKKQRSILGKDFSELADLSVHSSAIVSGDTSLVIVDWEKRLVHSLSSGRSYTSKLSLNFPLSGDLDKSGEYIICENEYYAWINGSFICVARYLPQQNRTECLHPLAPKVCNFKSATQNRIWVREGNQYQLVINNDFNRIDHGFMVSNHRLLIATDQGFAIQYINGPEWVHLPDAIYPWSVIADPGNKYIWTGTYKNGIIRLDKSHASATRFPLPERNNPDQQIFPGKLLGPDQTILFGGYKGFYHTQSGPPELFYLGESVEALAWDKEHGRYLVGSNKVYTVSRTFDQYGVFGTLPASDAGENETINDIELTPDGSVWVATTERIVQFDSEGRVLNSYNIDGIKCLLVDSKGVLWAAGKRIFHLKQGQFTPVKNILITSAVNNLLEVAPSRLIIVTELDVLLVNSQDLSQPALLNYWADFNGYKLLESSENGASFDGEYLWIPAGNGIQRIPASGLFATASLKPFLRVDRLNNELMPLTVSTPQNNVKGNSITVQLSLVNMDPGKTIFQYRLNGGGWITVAGIPNIPINNLKRGDNYIDFKAEYNALSVVTQLTVNADFPGLSLSYLRWFVPFFLGASGLLVLSFYRKKKQLRQAQLSTVQAQLNPHILFNMLSSLQNSIANRTKEESSSHLVQVAQLIREILEYSMPPEGNHKFPFLTISLEQEIAFLEKYLKLESLQHTFPFHFEIINQISHTSKGRLSVPPLLVQSLVENAILHGLRPKKDKNGYVKIVFEEKIDLLIISVIDNGVGINSAKNSSGGLFHYRSRGSELLRERLTLIGQLGYPFKLQTQPNPDGGTIATIQIKKMICA